MNGILIAFELVLIVPLFVATWRTSLLGLSLQGALMAWIAFRHGAHLSIDGGLEVLDLVVVRAILAPLVLYRVLRAQNAPRRNDVIPPNLLSWTLALALVVLGFRVGAALVPAEGDAQTLVAVSTSGVLLGLLVLSTRSSPFSQMIGALRIENGIALLELGSPHREAVAIRFGQTAVVLGAVLLFGWYLRRLDAAPAGSAEDPAL
jgi:hydrogenase-4 membrane subunit HyfE